MAPRIGAKIAAENRGAETPLKTPKQQIQQKIVLQQRAPAIFRLALINAFFLPNKRFTNHLLYSLMPRPKVPLSYFRHRAKQHSTRARPLARLPAFSFLSPVNKLALFLICLCHFLLVVMHIHRQ